MPKIRATDFNIQTGNVASVTVVMPTHEIGDTLLVFAGKDDATGTDPTTATTGWLRGGAGASAGATTAAVRAGWFVKRATSAAEADLVITSTDADTWSIIAISVRGSGPSLAVTAASWAASVATFTIVGHGYTTGAIVAVEGATPSGYDGTFRVATTPTADTFTVAMTANPGTYTSGGTSYCLVDNHSGNGSTDATGAPYAVTGVTTNYDKSLVIYACLSGGAGCPVHYPGLQGVRNVDSAAEGLGVAYTVQRTAGATGSKSFYTEAINTNTIGFCVAVRDDSTGQEAPYWDTDWATLVHPFRGSVGIITGDVWGTALTNYPSAGKDAVDACFQVDQSGGPSYVDYTTAANNATDADVIPMPATEAAGASGTGDWLAIGYEKPFMSLLFDRAGCTAGVAGVVVWEYWTGSAWAALTSVTDGTTSFTAAVADAQQVRWAMPPKFNWRTTSINGSAELFFVRARCSKLWSTNPTISQVFVGGHALLFDAIAKSADSGVIQFEDASTFTPATSTVQTGGTYMDLGQTVSLTNKVVVGTYAFSLPRDYVDAARFKEGGGVHVMFADTSFNRKTWCVGSYLDAQTAADKRNRFAIDWEQVADTTHSRTTVDPSDTVSDVFFGGLAPRGALSFFASHMLAVEPANAVLNGGSATVPITAAEFLAMGDASPVQLFRDGTITIPVTFGGSGSMAYELDGFTFSFPGVATPWTDLYNASPRSICHYDVGVLGFTFDCRSGDVMKMTNGKISSDSAWKFDVLGTASVDATWDFSGLLLVNANVSLAAVHTFASMTFQSCPAFYQNASAIDSCAFSGTTVTCDDPSLLTDNAFTRVASVDALGDETPSHAIFATTAGTYTFTGNSFTGYSVVLKPVGFNTTTDINAGTDVVTAAAHGFVTGNRVSYEKQGGVAVIGLTDSGLYYVRALTSGTLSLYDYLSDANADTNRVNLSSTGSETHYLSSIQAAFSNESAGLITLNISGGGDIPSVRNTNGSSTVIESPVSTTVTVLDISGGAPISGARVLVTASDNTGPMPFDEAVTITRSGAVATVTHASHGLVSGKQTLIKGATQQEYNGVFTITVTGPSAYTYAVSGTPATPATGTIKSTGVVIYGTTNGSGVITDSRTHTTSQPITGRVRSASSGTKYKTGVVSGTVSSATGFSVTVQLIADQ